jgi:tRNA U34 5-carboxymethylaminomethyl modifying GTPase MnmE/TrmE
MVGGLFENMGIEITDLNSHKTVLAFLTGGLLPVISLTFAHMLVKFTEKNKEVVEDDKTDLTEEDIQKIIELQVKEKEKEKWTPSNEDLEKLEEILKNNHPVKSDVEHKPYKPSEEDLRKIEEVLNGYTEIVKENIDNYNQVVTEDIVEEPIEEIKEITEENQYDNTVYMGLLKKDEVIQSEEVEKKNDILTETDEDYKVLNYKKRDA